MKKGFFKNKDWNGIIVSAAVVVVILAGAFIVKHYQNRRETRRQISSCKVKLRDNADARRIYMATAAEITQSARLHRVADSLNNVSDTMIDNATARYYDRIDAKYTLDKFFYKKQIETLNKIIDEHLAECDIDDYDTYQYVMDNTPVDGKTPLAVFESIARVFGVLPTDFESAGVIFDMGDIFMFKSSRAQANFLRYLDDIERTETKDGKPNFEIPELAEVHAQYDEKKRIAARIDDIARYNDSIAQKNLARFDAIKEDLRRQIAEKEKKLKR